MLLETHALKFGDFTLKSGRKSPYFINTGNFNSASSLARLGNVYAAHLIEMGLADADFLFGPAYKGIPLAVSAGIALNNQYGRSIGIVFDRKEAKDHGEGGLLVGGPLQDGQELVMIEDVITAGTTIKATVALLDSIAKVKIRSVVVLVDRCEKGKGNISAVDEIAQSFNIKVSPVITIHDIIGYLSSAESGADRLSDEMIERMHGYLKEYAVQ